MKHWSETRMVLGRMDECARVGMDSVLATVVRVVGSAYRHEGAKLLVCADGTTAGNVSGGCLEQDVIEVARRVIRTGCPELRSYCSGHDEVEAWNLGLGCEGKVEVYVAPVRAPLPLARAILASHDPVPFVLCTALDGPTLTATATASEGDFGSPTLNSAVLARARDLLGRDCAGLEACAGRQVFFDALEPPPQLILCGAGEDAPALAHCAASVGFRVVIVDRRAGRLDPARFPAATRLVAADGEDLVGFADPTRSYAVVMTHSFADDAAYLAALLSTSIPYIGVLGPRRRTERMLDALSLARVTAVDEQRLHAPVGLDLAGEGAEQVALSIVAEILAFRSGRPLRSLRERALAVDAR